MSASTQKTLTINLDHSQKLLLDTDFVDPQFGRDPCCVEDLYDEGKLGYNKPTDQTENNDLITDSHVSDALRYALIDLWTVNPHSSDMSPLPKFQPRPQNQQTQIVLIDNQISPQLQVIPDGLTRFFSLSRNLPLKSIQKRLYIPRFRKVTIRWARRHGCFIKRHSESRLTWISITGSTYNFFKKALQLGSKVWLTMDN